MSVSVCLSVRGTTCLNFSFLCMLRKAVAHAPLAASLYDTTRSVVLPVLWMTEFAHNGQQ